MITRKYEDNRLYKVAVLDLNNDVPNQGLRAIKKLLSNFNDNLSYTVYNVRGKNELPDTSYDIYISSGGPGDPHEGNGVWEVEYFSLLDQLLEINRETPRTKFMFFICHSFQLACIYFKIGEIVPRKSMSFGTFPAHKTPAGKDDILFEGLDDPFCIADFRRYQVIQPDFNYMKEKGFKILAVEKFRPYVDFERAVMAIRFTPEFVGVQFHPEADSEGMLIHFSHDNIQAEIIDVYGQDKYDSMIEDLQDTSKIEKTHRTILPGFINRAMQYLNQKQTVLID